VDGAFEIGQVVIDGCLQNRVRGVEVSVGQVVPHTGNLPPRNGRLSVEQLSGQSLDCLAYLQQPDADSVEYQAIGKVSALQMRTNRIYRGLDI
jgi:hypothetical protein